MNNAIQAVAYENGAIRNAEGKLIAYFDKVSNELHINGKQQVFRAADMAHAMELGGEHA